jgi:hypothetical protein
MHISHFKCYAATHFYHVTHKQKKYYPYITQDIIYYV